MAAMAGICKEMGIVSSFEYFFELSVFLGEFFRALEFELLLALVLNIPASHIDLTTDNS
jgi:hypothetical protein